MELDFSRFFTTVSVNVFNLNNLGLVFHNLNKSVYFINFNQVNDLLLEKFSNSFINFFTELRIFKEKSF